MPFMQIGEIKRTDDTQLTEFPQLLRIIIGTCCPLPVTTTTLDWPIDYWRALRIKSQRIVRSIGAEIVWSQ
jgi:hypothetical protein